MRVLAIGDIHLADRAPSMRTDSYQQDILDKVEQAARIAYDHRCDVIACAGDVFHIKSASRNSHALVQATGRALKSTNLDVLIVPGNHDLQNDRLDSLSKQPLGTLAKMSGIDLLMGGSDEYPIFGLPYLHDWSMLPRYMKDYKAWAEKHKADDFDFWPLMVTHAPIFPAGEDPPYEYISAPDWAGLMEIGDCYYGHIHDPHGQYEPDPNVPVLMCNNGAISRGSLHEATLKREPAVTIWDSSKPRAERFERIPLDVRPVEAVFRMREKEDIDEKTNRVEQFLEQVGSTNLDGLSLEEVAHQARARGLKPATLKLIEEVLEGV